MINKFTFEGKVALVTGANSGMGLVTAKAFAEAGASVVLAGRREGKLISVAEEISANGGKAIAVRCDVAKEADVKALIEKTVATYGRLDVAFNNAGVISPYTATDELETEEWERIMTINLKGVWLCMKYELKQMLKQDSGVIVNNSSMGGLRAVPGVSAYSASKHGLLGLTKSAALEYANRGIRINAICPGMINTPMGDDLTGGDKQVLEEMKQHPPMKRFGESEEIADTVLWLCSPGASYVTGHALAVDGGITV